MLQTSERIDLVQIITRLAEFSGGTAYDRRVLIDLAGLRRFLPGLDLQGMPRSVAAGLVSRLEDFGYLPDRPHYHALGALLSYVLTLGDVPEADTRKLAGLILRHDLVRDASYLARLRSEYGLPEAPTGLPIQPAAPAPAAAPEGPDFEVAGSAVDSLETVINSEDNFLDIDLFLGAIYSAQAVCRIEAPEGAPKGTGLLIGPDLLLTNQHVLPADNYLPDAVARFDYRLDPRGVTSPGRVYRLRHDFYWSSEPKELDYALVRLQDEPLKHLAPDASMKGASMLDLASRGRHLGYLVLARRFVRARDRVNIIQHPNGNPLKAVLTQNYVVADMSPKRVHYVADTMPGSSGSPVFNQNWEVVALHHSGEPYPPDAPADPAMQAWKGKFRVNEGIPAQAILEDFAGKGLSRYLPRE